MGVIHPQIVVDDPQSSQHDPQAIPRVVPKPHLREEPQMHCPYCRHTDSKVLDSRVAEDGSSIRRRRQCPSCERRFTTIEQMQLVVVKRSGVVEPFNREKVINGVRKACKGRPVTEDQLARLGQLVEDSLRASGQPEVPADEVGVAILGPLRELDQVAYLRFASVYRQFESVDDFEAEIAVLRVESEPTGLEPLIPNMQADRKVSAFTPHKLTPARPGAVRSSPTGSP
jgi:transcriptional repressor NrdR